MITPRDKYLRKRFGITEAEYDAQMIKQGGGCRICGSLPKTRSLHVDHDHAIEKWVIKSHKVGKGLWRAYPSNGDGELGFICSEATKPKARALVKERLRRLSVRGILCFPCNKALQKFGDDPVKMRKAADYLQRYYDWVDGKLEREGFTE